MNGRTHGHVKIFCAAFIFRLFLTGVQDGGYTCFRMRIPTPSIESDSSTTGLTIPLALAYSFSIRNLFQSQTKPVRRHKSALNTSGGISIAPQRYWRSHSVRVPGKSSYGDQSGGQDEATATTTMGARHLVSTKP